MAIEAGPQEASQSGTAASAVDVADTACTANCGILWACCETVCRLLSYQVVSDRLQRLPKVSSGSSMGSKDKKSKDRKRDKDENGTKRKLDAEDG